MKYILYLALLFFVFAACNKSHLESFDYVATKRKIIEIDSIMREARIGKQNPKLYKSFCEDSVVTTYNDGFMESSEELAHDLLAGTTTPREDIKFHIYGMTAILSYLETPIEVVNEDTIIHTIRITKTFAYHNEQWKVAAISISPQMKNYFKPLAKQPALLRDFAGGYRWAPANGMPATIDSVLIRGDKLFFKSAGTEVIMFAVDDSIYMIKDDLIRTVFNRNSKGKVTHLTFVIYDGQRIRLPKVME